MDRMTPRQIVAELDKYIIGQHAAKRAVAIALRNRWRRQRLPAALRDEVAPKNIIMIGPTGVGKTEIARRLARLAEAPFIKVEASKYTEVGYVGRDVESMIRDLVELAVNMVRGEKTRTVEARAREMAEERLLDLLLPPARPGGFGAAHESGAVQETREKLRARLRDGPSKSRSRSERCRWSTSWAAMAWRRCRIISRRCWETSCRSAPAGARSRCTRPAAS